MYNLIEERWIPAVTDKGGVVYISPWEISRSDIALIDLAFERPDFNSAVYQFLVGLYQTIYTPKDDDEWLDRLEEPPDADVMHELMAPMEDKFELLGDWPRYMQDASVSSAPNKGIVGLLITNPGENTMKLGKDFFIKGRSGGALCLSCSSAALTAMQAIAPMGGAGLRASARGSSAITALIRGKTLWQNVYLNVLTSERLKRTGGQVFSANPFVWANGHCAGPVHPQDNSPLAIIWSMVRRIMLDEPSPGTCSVCGRECDCIYSFKEMNKGNEYPSWIHPLSPTYVTKDGRTLHKLMSRDLSHFHQWSALVYHGQDFARPSLNVSQMSDNKNDLSDILHSEPRLWINGYQNKQALPECWVDVMVPVYTGYGDEGVFDSFVRDLIRLSKKTERSMLDALKRTLGDAVNKSSISSNFWSACDSAFIIAVSQYSPEGRDQIIENWIVKMREIAFRVFDEVTETVPLEDYGKAVMERSNLSRQLSKKSMMKELSKE